MLIAGLAGYFAKKAIQKGSPPAPTMAIAEVKETKRHSRRHPDRATARAEAEAQPSQPQPTTNDPEAPRPLAGPIPQRSEIRADIEAAARSSSADVCRERCAARVAELTDWRKQVSDHREQIVKGAVVAGFVVGG